MPDPVGEAIELVLKDLAELRSRLKRLEDISGLVIPRDEPEEKRRKIIREFAQGDGI